MNKCRKISMNQACACFISPIMLQHVNVTWILFCRYRVRVQNTSPEIKNLHSSSISHQVCMLLKMTGADPGGCNITLHCMHHWDLICPQNVFECIIKKQAHIVFLFKHKCDMIMSTFPENAWRKYTFPYSFVLISWNQDVSHKYRPEILEPAPSISGHGGQLNIHGFFQPSI